MVVVDGRNEAAATGIGTTTAAAGTHIKQLIDSRCSPAADFGFGCISVSDHHNFLHTAVLVAQTGSCNQRSNMHAWYRSVQTSKAESSSRTNISCSGIT